jgi:peroxiredoxin (alkyl hydroperoxide reductase subunit C)
MRAADFDLPCTPRADDDEPNVSLDDYRDRWLVLLFYPRDFSMVCPTELTALSRQYDEFTRRDCDILGISTDSVDSHMQWISTAASCRWKKPRTSRGRSPWAWPALTPTRSCMGT